MNECRDGGDEEEGGGGGGGRIGGLESDAECKRRQINCCNFVSLSFFFYFWHHCCIAAAAAAAAWLVVRTAADAPHLQ